MSYRSAVALMTRLAVLITAAAPPVALVALQAASPGNILLVLLFEAVLLAVTVGRQVLEGLRERWVDRLTDVADAAVQRVFSRFAGRYRRYVADAHGHIDTTGLTTTGEYTFSLAEVFVNLRLGSRAAHRVERSSAPAARSVFTVSPRAEEIWSWIERAREHHESLAVLGAPGSGKTTLLKHLCFVLATQGPAARRIGLHKALPSLVYLRDCKDMFSDASQPTLADVIRMSVGPIAAAEPPNWFETALHRRRFVLLLDGLDEIPSTEVRTTVTSWAERQRATYPKLIVVLTSRPFGYYENPLPVATTLEVAPFSSSDIERFISSWYFATTARAYGGMSPASRLAATKGARDLLLRIRSTAHLHELAVNPLLLTMIANVHRYRGALPGNRSELYKEICEVFLGKRHAARGVPIEMTAAQRQFVLEELAYLMMVAGSRDVTLAVAERHLGSTLQRVQPGMHVGTFLRRIEESSGLVVERERDIYSFSHLTFQEYLAAAYVRRERLIERLIDKVDDSWWQEVLRLYCSETDATPVISACLRTARSDVRVLRLAVECLTEAREVDPAVRADVDAVVNPSVSAGLTARQVRLAGLVRVLMRAGDFVAVDDDVYVSSSAITGYEYDAFLNGSGRRPALAPRHWKGRTCPQGLGPLPVTGVDSDSAAMFAGWVKGVLPGGWTYRLPRQEEMDAYFATVDREQSSTLIDSTQPGQYFTPSILRPAAGWEPPAEVILSSMREDLSQSQVDGALERMTECLGFLGAEWSRQDLGSIRDVQVLPGLVQVCLGAGEGMIRALTAQRNELLDNLIASLDPALLKSVQSALVAAASTRPENPIARAVTIVAFNYDRKQAERAGALRLSEIRRSMGPRGEAFGEATFVDADLDEAEVLDEEPVVDEVVRQSTRWCVLALAIACQKQLEGRQEARRLLRRAAGGVNKAGLGLGADRRQLLELRNTCLSAYALYALIEGELQNVWRPEARLFVARSSR